MLHAIRGVLEFEGSCFKNGPNQELICQSQLLGSNAGRCTTTPSEATQYRELHFWAVEWHTFFLLFWLLGSYCITIAPKRYILFSPFLAPGLLLYYHYAQRVHTFFPSLDFLSLVDPTLQPRGSKC